jgi:hypothetical protein
MDMFILMIKYECFLFVVVMCACVCAHSVHVCAVVFAFKCAQCVRAVAASVRLGNSVYVCAGAYD